ncbi:DIE2/ALG10 family protein [Tanacetum coccineum]
MKKKRTSPVTTISPVTTTSTVTTISPITHTPLPSFSRHRHSPATDRYHKYRFKRDEFVKKDGYKHPDVLRAKAPGKMHIDEWNRHIDFFLRPNQMKKSETNSKNRSKQPYSSVQGTRTNAASRYSRRKIGTYGNPDEYPSLVSDFGLNHIRKATEKISTSVFVTNFPEQASAKDLWNACKQYGHVVDAFIPNKRSKAGKRFGFVLGGFLGGFIKVFDVERLVGNLCTVWIGRHRIHANAARFHRPKGSTSSHQPAMKGKIIDSSIGKLRNNVGWGHRMIWHCEKKEGLFTDIDLRYMGGLWVMIAFDSVEAKEKFLLSTGVCSWFSQLIQASSEFTTDERVTMVEIEGGCEPIEIQGCTPDLDEQNDEESDSEDAECEEVFKKDFGESDEEVQGENDVSRVSDTDVEEENPKSKDDVVSSEQNGKQSEDPFNIYSLLNKDKMKNNKEASTKESLEYHSWFLKQRD